MCGCITRAIGNTNLIKNRLLQVLNETLDKEVPVTEVSPHGREGSLIGATLVLNEHVIIELSAAQYRDFEPVKGDFAVLGSGADDTLVIKRNGETIGEIPKKELRYM